MQTKTILILSIALIALVRADTNAAAAAATVKTDLYKYDCKGKCDNKASGVATSRGIVLMGGGLDVDNAYVWMINKAKGGNFLVIRTTGSGDYDPYIYGLGTLKSAATLILTNRSSSFDPFVIQRLQQADAIYMAGGDQWDYYSMWKDTPIESIFNNASKYIPVGGTSAGMESMGQFMNTAQFSAKTDLDSPTALANPYDKLLTIGENFINVNYMQNVLCDAHFFERDRMGRLLAYLARLLQDVFTGSSARGIACDEGTAILVEANGTASITSWYNNGSCYFVNTNQNPTVCQPKQPLSIQNITVSQFQGNASAIFDLGTWAPIKPKKTRTYTLNVNNGNITSSDGSVY